MSKTIRVKITASQRVAYVREFDMPQEHYQKYLEMTDANASDEEFSREFGECYIDPLNHWLDADDYDDVFIEPVKD